ncbi:MAG: GntR family transcriptional regulator [Spirochaetota bacterium]|nr:GntR family transcriptional regulator [Spirochaetota bacterium]
MEFEQDKAIYAQIADRIMENIIEGSWEEGERIPSVRELAVSLEVNPNTVVRAFNYLQEQEIIFNKRGIGYFVADRGRDMAQKLKRSEFIQKDLPHLFRSINMLDLSFDEIEREYEKFIKTEEAG